MELVQKGKAAEFEPFKQLLCKLKWTTAADFDVAVVYEPKTGPTGLVYFGSLGSKDQFPFILLNKDEGVGDKGGRNEEVLRVFDVEPHNKIHLLVWDYGRITSGGPGRFSESDVSLTVTDDNSKVYGMELKAGSLGNLIVLATIDNTKPMGAQFLNVSKAGTLKEFNHLNQLLDVINS